MRLLLALPLILYLIWPTRNFYWDGVAIAIEIEKHPPLAALFYPSHLLFSVSGSWLYEWSGHYARALYLMQTANCVIGGLCVILFEKCLRLRGFPASLSIPSALVFAFSATWWKFTTDANAYVPSIFFLLCTYILLERRGTLIYAALTFACAMLFHQLALFFLPVALVRQREGRKLFAALSLAPVALIYGAAYMAVAEPKRNFLAWLMWHSPDSSFSFHPITNAVLSLRGTLRLFFGGRVAEIVPDLLTKIAFVLLAAATVAFAIACWRARPSWSKPPLDWMVWLGIYLAFLYFWMPQNTFYRLFYLPPLIAIIAYALRSAPAVVWTLAPVLLLWNFAFLIDPHGRPELNAPLHFALEHKSSWPPGTPIVYGTFHPDLWTISYFNQQASWMSYDGSSLNAKLAYAKSVRQPLWLEETAYLLAAATPDGKNWLAEHEQPGKLIEFKDDRHDFRFHCLQ
jgi:hypothetical protein